MEKTENIDGFTCYAPTIARENDYFPVEGFEVTKSSHFDSFWYRSRNRLFAYLLKNIMLADRTLASTFIEIGCGSGAVLNCLARMGLPIKFSGVEGHLTGLRQARERLPKDINLVQANALDLPFANQFDFAGLFDVIEHIQDDQKAIEAAALVLASGGRLIISVPQHNFLWSEADINSGHKRRYSRADLIAKVRRAGLEPIFTSSFLFIVLPVMMLSRFSKQLITFLRGPKPGISVELALPPWLDRCLDQITRIDEFLIHKGISLPVGGTLVLIAQKNR